MRERQRILHSSKHCSVRRSTNDDWQVIVCLIQFFFLLPPSSSSSLTLCLVVVLSRCLSVRWFYVHFSSLRSLRCCHLIHCCVEHPLALSLSLFSLTLASTSSCFLFSSPFYNIYYTMWNKSHPRILKRSAIVPHGSRRVCVPLGENLCTVIRRIASRKTSCVTGKVDIGCHELTRIIISRWNRANRWFWSQGDR